MERLKKTFFAHKEFLLVFGCEMLFFLERFNFRGLVSGDYRSLYLSDFNVGVCSRTFIGQLISLFTDSVTQEFLCAFALANILLYFLLFSFLAGKALKKAQGEISVLLLCAVMLASRCSLRFYFSGSWTTLFDNFWLTTFALSIICIKNKYAKWLLPLLCVFGLGTHYAFAFAFLPPVLALMLFEIYKDKKGRINNIAAFCVTTATSAAACVYFFLLAPNYLKMNMEQAHTYIQNKFSEPLTFSILDSYFYVRTEVGENLSSTKEMIGYMFSRYAGFELSTLLAVVPVLLIFAAFWIYMFKKSDSKPFKALTLLNLVLPLGAVPAVLTSLDRLRFCIPMVMAQAVTVLYYRFSDEPNTVNALRKISAFLKKRLTETVCLCALYIIYVEAAYVYNSVDCVHILCLAASAALIYKNKPWFSLIAAAAASAVDISFSVRYFPAIAVMCVCASLYSAAENKNLKKGGKSNKTGKTASPAFGAVAAVYVAAALAGFIYMKVKGGYKLSFNSYAYDTVICAVFTAVTLCVSVYALLAKGKGKKEAVDSRVIIAFTSVLSAAFAFCVYLFGFSELSFDASHACRIAAGIIFACTAFLFCRTEKFVAKGSLLEAKDGKASFVRILIPLVLAALSSAA